MTDPEFSFLVPIARIRAIPSRYTITADESERAALARRFGLESLDRLEASVTLGRVDTDIRLDATFEADLTQVFVDSGEPFAATIAETAAVIYRPGLSEDEADRLALDDPDGVLIEPLIGDAIDIGEVVAQELAVAIDPYPRADGGADQLADSHGDSDEARRPSPFEVLARPKRC
jgi:hypothetical protein